ncbi:putative E3 ubiquitin-protein ligase XERICO [Iris pallida]|uniref:E3 ubiquitin-protein ligase XERICO n=1 Tax=Iris pallida TaxID=29817 RepID=A0AAX6FQI9_IRIPA|nr:putative E3 ubiquitin-protein ligase XERICO [Iris pallida]
MIILDGSQICREKCVTKNK